MTDAMKIVRPEPVHGRMRESVADGLAAGLVDTYRLLFKTHAFHWNVEGQLFHAIRAVTGAQAAELLAAADLLAERLRALGRFAPATLGDVIAASVVRDAGRALSAPDMVCELAGDHGAVSRRMRDLVTAAVGQNDPVTEGLAIARVAAHDRAAWTLRATAR